MTNDNRTPIPMATAGRQSRFTNLTMTNGADRASQPIGSGFQVMDSIWSNSGGIGTFAKREATGSRGSDDKAFDAPSGSGALTADSEVDTWAPRGPWNNSDSAAPRKTSGSTSPNRTRDLQNFADLSSNSTYFTTTRQAPGQASGYPANVGKPQTSGLDPSSNAFKYNGNGVSDRPIDKAENGSGPFPSLGRYDADSPMRNMRLDRRNPQEAAFLNVGGPTRDAGATNGPTGHTELDSMQQSFNAPFGGHHSGVGHAHRPSVHASASFPVQLGASSRGNSAMSHHNMDDGELHERFKRSFTLGDAPDAAASAGSSAFHGKPQQPFQFNPGSAPWDSSVAKPFGGPVGGSTGTAASAFVHDTHSETIMSGYASGKRGSLADRGSPAGNPFRSNMTSPRHMSEAPSDPADVWSRPASRDTRNGQEMERRSSANPYAYVQGSQNGQYLQTGHQFLQNGHFQHPPPPQMPPAFFPSQAYYNPGMVGQAGHLYGSQTYQAQPFDPYGVSFRNAQMGHQPVMPVMPFPQYGQNHFATLRHGRDQDPTNGARSRLLDEFRANGKAAKSWELKEIYNHVVEFSGDQHGSRFIQSKLETANSDEKDQLFRELEPNAVQLMKDVFGNYVIQKFFEHGSQVQKKIVADKMKGKMLDLSTQMYACRVVQKALEHILREQQAELVKELESDVLRIVKDQNGNHVVQKIIELVPRHHIRFVMDSFRGVVSQLASHTYGCRVIQRMLEHGSDEDKAAIMAELHSCATSLITCQYGNYVIQHVIEHGRPQDRERTIDIVLQQLLVFSKHKFASNVVEKCIVFGGPKDRTRIRELLSRPGPDGTSPLQMLMKDQYGNYVIQKLLEQLQGPERDGLVEEMKPQFNSLKKISNGRQIAAIDRLMSATSSPAGTPGPNGPASPASPGLQVDVNSAAPTPVLTMEPNTPQSSSPPSTNASADDVADEPSLGTGKANPAVSSAGPLQIRVADA